MSAPNLRETTEPDSCANCVFLGWGEEQGWDNCRKNGIMIYWPKKSKQVCDNHELSSLDDPRNG